MLPELGIIGRGLKSGEAVPMAQPEWIVTSSSNCAWRTSFKVEHHVRPPHEQPEIVLPEANVHFHTDAMKNRAPVEWRVNGGPLQTKTMHAGDVGIAAEGTTVWGRDLGQTDIIIISFSPAFLAAAAGDSATRRVEFKGISHIDDQLIRALGSQLEMEVRAGCPTGRTYGESLGLALAAHLVSRYATDAPKSTRYVGGLSRSHLRRVIDYIIANLAEDNGVDELAGLVQLSPSHFCRAFKQSTGVSPHQYILQRRIDEAKRLLLNSSLSIAQIAFRIGFSDQSHFTMIFRRLVGATPARWRV